MTIVVSCGGACRCSAAIMEGVSVADEVSGDLACDPEDLERLLVPEEGQGA